MEKKKSKLKAKLPFPHDPSVETVGRTVYKTVTYRIIISAMHFAVIYYITGRARIALGFVVLSSIYSMITFYLHDRIWDKVKWGKVDPPVN
jgi:uncharacterized membrane protein